MKLIVALLCGIIFSLGLTISGMVNPYKVLNFLDITGQWDPSLAFVMIGALAVFGSGYWLFVVRSPKPLLGERYQIPENKTIDKPLVIGAIVFGVGWGLTGICPGPALANISGLEGAIFLFVIAMIVGMLSADKLMKK